MKSHTYIYGIQTTQHTINRLQTGRSYSSRSRQACPSFIRTVRKIMESHTYHGNRVLVGPYP